MDFLTNVSYPCYFWNCKKFSYCVYPRCDSLDGVITQKIFPILEDIHLGKYEGYDEHPLEGGFFVSTPCFLLVDNFLCIFFKADKNIKWIHHWESYPPKWRPLKSRTRFSNFVCRTFAVARKLISLKCHLQTSKELRQSTWTSLDVVHSSRIKNNSCLRKISLKGSMHCISASGINKTKVFLGLKALCSSV